MRSFVQQEEGKGFLFGNGVESGRCTAFQSLLWSIIACIIAMCKVYRCIYKILNSHSKSDFLSVVDFSKLSRLAPAGRIVAIYTTLTSTKETSIFDSSETCDLSDQGQHLNDLPSGQENECPWDDSTTYSFAAA